MQCPQCRHGLTIVTHKGVAFETCKACRGLWFDSHEVVHYLHRRVQESNGAPTPHKESPPQLPPGEAGFCPRFNQLLELHHIGASALHFRKFVNCSGVWIDRKYLAPLARWFATASACEQSPLYGRVKKMRLICGKDH